MSEIDLFRLMASYNAWMNGRLYDAAAGLEPTVLHAERGAFFGSIFGTLNHLVVADTIWLKRFATSRNAAALAPLAEIPAPTSLREEVAPDLAELRTRRDLLDRLTSAWVADLTDADLAEPLAYRRVNGTEERKTLGPLVMHFFNHQTHHRGQATTLFMQAGIDVGVTDLLALIPSAAT